MCSAYYYIIYEQDKDNINCKCLDFYAYNVM